MFRQVLLELECTAARLAGERSGVTFKVLAASFVSFSVTVRRDGWAAYLSSQRLSKVFGQSGQENEVEAVGCNFSLLKGVSLKGRSESNGSVVGTKSNGPDRLVSSRGSMVS